MAIYNYIYKKKTLYTYIDRIHTYTYWKSIPQGYGYRRYASTKVWGIRFNSTLGEPCEKNEKEKELKKALWAKKHILFNFDRRNHFSRAGIAVRSTQIYFITNSVSENILCFLFQKEPSSVMCLLNGMRVGLWSRSHVYRRRKVLLHCTMEILRKTNTHLCPFLLRSLYSPLQGRSPCTREGICGFFRTGRKRTISYPFFDARLWKRETCIVRRLPWIKMAPLGLCGLCSLQRRMSLLGHKA